MNIADINKRLRRVQKFNVEISSANDCLAAGQGTVDVENNTPGSITWRENGRWNHHFNYLEFTNVYRWSGLYDSRLGLEHLRYGDQNPVKLVELVKTSKNFWISACPHLCGQDSYQLTMSINANELTMVWHIDGPDKNQISTICYSYKGSLNK